MPTIQAAQLEQLVTDICRGAGVAGRDARVVARHLVDANLAGHDSHGVMRIIQYVQEIEDGNIVPGAKVKLLEEWDSGARIDASGVLGQVACHDAMQLAIRKARHATLAAVVIRNANHSGRLGTYVEMAAASGMIGLVAANGGGAGQWVAPFGGRERRLSTNPLAFGAPSGKTFPIILDISTSVVPEGKVRHCLARGQSAPDGWLIDADGLATNDPATLYDTPSGALLPLGGPAGHKGYGLAFMVDILAGALSGAGCPRAGEFDPNHGSGLFMLAIDVERFGPLSSFSETISEMADYVRSSQAASGFERVLVPGEYETQHRERRRTSGIDIPDPTYEQIRSIAERLAPHRSETKNQAPPPQEKRT